MKKLLLTLSLLCIGIVGISTAGAQYSYDSSNYYYDSTYTNTSYSSYSYPAQYSYPASDYGNYYGSYGHGIGSYTIGCITYYYNTRTGAQLYTQNICPTSNYTYPDYGYGYGYSHSQYCTWGYHNGSWRPCYSGNSWSGGNNNYLNCYYDWRGQYICW